MATKFNSNELAAHLAAPADSESAFLLFLGRHVRAVRARRGMTRKMVAKDADVSERHLAQLEAGEGNVSVVLLRRIALALNVSLVELFAPETEEFSEKRMIQEFLEHLPKHRLEEILGRLTRSIQLEEKRRSEHIALIGLRGAGKSTLGSRLSQERNVPFIELDREIEKETGMPLDEIFSLYGQAGYRRIEKRALKRVLQEQPSAVLSVGGGVVSEKETYEYLLAHCYTVWVKAQPEEHMARVVAQGDFRAMAENDEAMEDLRSILDAREPLYRRADLQLDTSGEAVAESFQKLKLALQTEFA